MTYDIKSIDNLESSTSNLATINQKVSSDVASLAYILNSIKINWQNETGADLASIITELEGCINRLQNAITPTVGKYVDTMNNLVAESRSTQSRTMM